MEIIWWPLRGLDIQRNSEGQREIKLYDEFSKGSWYRINSITLFKESERIPCSIELHYTSYDIDKHELNLYTKKATIIVAAETYARSADEYKKNELYLLEFGKGLARHLDLYFFRFGKGGYKCCICNQAIGLDKIDYTQYKLEKLTYKLDKATYPNLDSVSRGQANSSITNLIKIYDKEIKEYMYCSECINKIRNKYIGKINSIRDSNR